MEKVLYLIQHQNIPDYTKIGFTTNLKQRVAQLQTASPTGIRVIWSIKSDRADDLEAYLHRRWSHKNTNLEWFALTHEDIVDIIFDVESKLVTKA